MYIFLMTFEVSLKKTSEGYSVWCPALRGCWSQGATKADALRNIRSAIKDYLAVARALARKQGKTVKVRVAA